MTKISSSLGILLALTAALLVAGCNLQTLFGPDDKAIVSEVQAKLFQDQVLKTRDIHVASARGVVVLTGTVNADTEKAQAESLASGVRGVKQVSDQLTVSAPAPAVAQAPEEVSPPARAEPPRHVAQRPKKASRRATAPPREVASTEPVRPGPAPESAPAPAANPAPPPPPAPVRATIAAGTVVTVRMIDAIDSSRNRPGEEFTATVDSPLVVNDRVVVPRGSDAHVRLVQSRSAGHMSGESELQLELIEVSVNGTPYVVQSSYYELHGASRGKRTAETVGGGAAVGALIGAILGKGKGAAIGAGVGAAAGTGVQAATRGQQVRVPSETKIDFTLKNSLTVTL